MNTYSIRQLSNLFTKRLVQALASLRNYRGGDLRNSTLWPHSSQEPHSTFGLLLTALLLAALTLLACDSMEDDKPSTKSKDKIRAYTIAFSEPVKIASPTTNVKVGTTASKTDKTFGTDVTIKGVNADGKGFAVKWQITLGTGYNVAAGDVIWIAKEHVVDRAGNKPVDKIVFTVPKPKTEKEGQMGRKALNSRQRGRTPSTPDKTEETYYKVDETPITAASSDPIVVDDLQ